MILSAQLSVDSGDFVIEHLTDSEEDRNLLMGFVAGKGAGGLEGYLKSCALDDEDSGESRTYLVKDSVSRALACYFSLRTCLVPLALDSETFVTMPAIELSNFAVNEQYRQAQKKARKIGAYVFLEFILPIVRHAAGIVGAKWLCVYSLPRAGLMKYYKSLGFQSLAPDDEAFVYSHVKPKYDSDCVFMYQSIGKPDSFHPPQA